MENRWQLFNLHKKTSRNADGINESAIAIVTTWQIKYRRKITPAQISMGKRNNVETALRIARDCRQICGAMGITQDFPFMRHAMNLESVITYEGTHEVHLLITGMDMTGENAFG